ncbi:MAG TPA: alpha/beta fold hydrolase [Thermoanaerobaculia bacterium]|nr:alpha/beta fold hydrolase [Thermoanaerobaculia bacterium]
MSTFERIELPPWTVREYRAGTGPPLVLLHGLSGSFEWWKKNINALAERFTVFGVDLVGFGADRTLTDAPLPLPLDDAVTLVERWITARIGEPVHLVGHSMGGAIAIHFAASFPASTRSLTLVSSAGLPVMLRPGPHVRAMLRPPSTLLSFVPVLMRDFMRAGPTSVGLALSEVLRRDVSSILPTLDIPTLLIWGDRDPVIPLSYAERFRQLLPASSLEVLDGAGHVPMWDQPARFNEILLDFLVSLEAAPRSMRDALGAAFTWGVRGCEGGICHRASTGSPAAVLIHGLGIRSGYFRRLARDLWTRGIGAIAPDLPGYGHSRQADARTIDEVVLAVIRWADEVGLGGSVWLGHSTGAQIVEKVQRARPDLVRASFMVSPIWSREPHRQLSLPLQIALDGLREPYALIALAVRSYWDSGLLRIVRSFLDYSGDASTVPESLPPEARIVIGETDPLLDRECLKDLGAKTIEIDGAHGIVYSSSERLAEIVSGQSETGFGGDEPIAPSSSSEI